MKHLKTYESFNTNVSIDVLNYDDFFKLIYGSGGSPNDKTIFKRIPYMDARNDFGWNAKDNNPYYIVLKEVDKIIGVAKIGNYPHTPDNHYYISYFSIDKDYRNMGYSNKMADELFKFAKEKGFVIETSTYTYVGKLLLKKIFNKYADKWGVEFIDMPEDQGLIDREDNYNVVDNKFIRYDESNNNTMILYHGSPNRFETFDTESLGSNMGRTPSNMKGFFFSDSKEVAQSFGDNLYTAEVTINNPYTVDANGKDYSEFKHELNDIVDNIGSEYDSIIIKNYKDSYHSEPMMSNQYIVFDTNNIKIL